MIFYFSLALNYIINFCNAVLQPTELEGFLVLLNQLICKFGAEVRDLLEVVYPVIASRAFNILPRGDIQSGPGSCAEVCELDPEVI